MEYLPNELLEKIISCITDRKTLGTCRRVNKRWNIIAVKYWRDLPSAKVTFLTGQIIHEFLTDMEYGIQDFPFSRFRLLNVNVENVQAVKEFLHRVAPFIKELEIDEFHGSLEASETDFNHLFDSINELSKLRVLTIGRMIWKPTFEIPPINLPNLQTLRLTTYWSSERLGRTLISGAPNLDVVEIWINNPNQMSQLLTKDSERIKTIVANISLNIFVAGFLSTRLQEFVNGIEQRNVRVKNLSLCAAVTHPNRVEYTKACIQQLLASHRNTIQSLQLNARSDVYNVRVNLPRMDLLRILDIDFNSNFNRIDRICGNPYENLRVVILRCFVEPTDVFYSAHLPTVKFFELGVVTRAQRNCEYTRWDRVFPHLETFLFDTSESYGVVDFLHVNFLVTHMRMESLTRVEYRLWQIRENRHTLHSTQSINHIFSGFRNFDEIMEQASRITEGEEAKLIFWKSVEHTRAPCIVNMKGLKHFLIDQMMGDDFAISTLMQMKPLDVLIIPAQKMSIPIFWKLINRHKYSWMEMLPVEPARRLPFHTIN